MKHTLGLLTAIIGLILMLVVAGSFYTIGETEHAIITQFGKVIGPPISEPGLRFKVPFIQDVNRIEKRLLNWDGRPIEIPTKDKAYISVDTFARWRVVDPVQFYLRLRDARSAESRLEDILGSETRNAIARNELIEIVRTDKARQPKVDESLKAAATANESGGNKLGVLPPIRVGRALIEEEIKKGAAPKLRDFGIDLLDVRFKRINYNEEVLASVYKRMISERQQIAQRFRSEGEAEAARIVGNRERDLFEIESAAYRKVQELRGQADGEASRIYADAYGSNAAAPEFYRFLKGLETFRSAVGKDTTLLFSTDSDLFRLFKKSAGDPLPQGGRIPPVEGPSPVPAPAPGQ